MPDTHETLTKTPVSGPITPDSTSVPTWPTRTTGVAILDANLRIPSGPDDEADVSDYPLTGGRP